VVLQVFLLTDNHLQNVNQEFDAETGHHPDIEGLSNGLKCDFRYSSSTLTPETELKSCSGNASKTDGVKCNMSRTYNANRTYVVERLRESAVVCSHKTGIMAEGGRSSAALKRQKIVAWVMTRARRRCTCTISVPRTQFRQLIALQNDDTE
jgi:hypothetical protein